MITKILWVYKNSEWNESYVLIEHEETKETNIDKHKNKVFLVKLSSPDVGLFNWIFHKFDIGVHVDIFVDIVADVDIDRYRYSYSCRCRCTYRCSYRYRYTLSRASMVNKESCYLWSYGFLHISFIFFAGSYLKCYCILNSFRISCTGMLNRRSSSMQNQHFSWTYSQL